MCPGSSSGFFHLLLITVNPFSSIVPWLMAMLSLFVSNQSLSSFPNTDIDLSGLALNPLILGFFVICHGRFLWLSKILDLRMKLWYFLPLGCLAFLIAWCIRRKPFVHTWLSFNSCAVHMQAHYLFFKMWWAVLVAGKEFGVIFFSEKYFHWSVLSKVIRPLSAVVHRLRCHFE